MGLFFFKIWTQLQWWGLIVIQPQWWGSWRCSRGSHPRSPKCPRQAAKGSPADNENYIGKENDNDNRQTAKDSPAGHDIDKANDDNDEQRPETKTNLLRRGHCLKTPRSLFPFPLLITLLLLVLFLLFLLFSLLLLGDINHFCIILSFLSSWWRCGVFPATLLYNLNQVMVIVYQRVSIWPFMPKNLIHIITPIHVPRSLYCGSHVSEVRSPTLISTTNSSFPVPSSRAFWRGTLLLRLFCITF